MNRERTLLGACLALANAVRILEDAAMLYAAGRAPTSFHLAVIAREELGRFNILVEVAQELVTVRSIAANDIRERTNPRTKAHQTKLQAGQSTYYLKAPLPKETFVERQKRYAQLRKADSDALHSKRLSAQYVNLNDDETWSTPNDIADSDALEIIWMVSGEIGDSLRWVESDGECKGLLDRVGIFLPMSDDFLARTLVLPSLGVATQFAAPGDVPQ